MKKKIIIIAIIILALATWLFLWGPLGLKNGDPMVMASSYEDLASEIDGYDFILPSEYFFEDYSRTYFYYNGTQNANFPNSNMTIFSSRGIFHGIDGYTASGFDDVNESFSVTAKIATAGSSIIATQIYGGVDIKQTDSYVWFKLDDVFYQIDSGTGSDKADTDTFLQIAYDIIDTHNNA